MCAKIPRAPSNISQWKLVIMQNTNEKANLQKTKENTMKITKVHVDGINLVLGKNGGHRPSSLGSRLIVVISERDKNS